MYGCVDAWMCRCIDVFFYIYIYIYRERERERGRQRCIYILCGTRLGIQNYDQGNNTILRYTEALQSTNTQIYIYIYIYIYTYK